MVRAIEEEIDRTAGVLHDKLTLRYAMQDFSHVHASEGTVQCSQQQMHIWAD